MRLFRPAPFARLLYREAIFRIRTGEKSICLTFDDGPEPESTPLLLNILGNQGIKSIFFCDGRKAEQNPDLIRAIRAEGHITGNHGYGHPDGWKMSCQEYTDNIEKASEFTSKVLFRPPYGHLTSCQYKSLLPRYTLVFWDLMPYDFDRAFGSANCLRVFKRDIRSGSVVVLHDTSSSLALEITEDILVHAKSEGYEFIIPGDPAETSGN